MSTSATALSLVLVSLAVGCARQEVPASPADSPSLTTAPAAPPPPATEAPAAPLPSTSTAPASGDLAVGKAAPDFTVKDQDGKELKLAALKGKSVVVYFYPKDETPGCTKEACAFRDSWKDIEKKGVVLIGVSTDNAASHKAFASHHKLPFHLVSDESGTLAKSFGVPNNGGYLGRQSFVIGPDGNLKKIYREVDVTKHASEILADVTP